MEAFNVFLFDVDSLIKCVGAAEDGYAMKHYLEQGQHFVKSLKNPKKEQEYAKFLEALHDDFSNNEVDDFFKRISMLKEWFLCVGSKHLLEGKGGKLPKKGLGSVVHDFEAWVTNFVIQVLPGKSKKLHDQYIQIIQDYLNLSEPFRTQEFEGTRVLIYFIWIAVELTFKKELTLKEHKDALGRMKPFCDGYYGLSLLEVQKEHVV